MANRYFTDTFHDLHLTNKTHIKIEKNRTIHFYTISIRTRVLFAFINQLAYAMVEYGKDAGIWYISTVFPTTITLTNGTWPHIFFFFFDKKNVSGMLIFCKL